MMLVRAVDSRDYQDILNLLRRNQRIWHQKNENLLIIPNPLKLTNYRDFFPHEPAAIGLNLCPQGYTMPAVEENILGMLDKGVSSVVTKDGEEIVGVVICDVLEITSAGHGHQSSTGQVMPAKFIQLQAFFDDLSTKFGTDNVWDKYEKEESMDICMLCIKQEERHKGLGALLVSQALQTAQDHGIELIHSLALSAFSQAIFEKYGFKTENEISYDTYSQDGEIIFDVSKMDEIHKSGKFMVMAK